jgi:hypothetical protein
MPALQAAMAEMEMDDAEATEAGRGQVTIASPPAPCFYLKSASAMTKCERVRVPAPRLDG